jgi:hypothetical protein
MNGFFGDVIYSYTRAQSDRDGVLVGVTDTAKEMGFKFPVAVTSSVWQIIVPDNAAESLGESTSGRLWDCLWMLFVAIKRGGNGGTVPFEFIATEEGRQKLVRLKAVCGPGDNMEPVITITLPSED